MVSLENAGVNAPYMLQCCTIRAVIVEGYSMNPHTPTGDACDDE